MPFHPAIDELHLVVPDHLHYIGNSHCFLLSIDGSEISYWSPVMSTNCATNQCGRCIVSQALASKQWHRMHGFGALGETCAPS